MAKDLQQVTACDVVVSPGKVYGASVATKVSGLQISGTCSVLCDGGLDYRGVLLNEPAVAATLPNQFYGVAEYTGVDIEIANLDETFSHLIEDDERGSFVVIRRYDPGSQTILPVASGIIDQTQIGDAVTLRLAAHNLARLTDNFPRKSVTLNEFPTATDFEAPIPVFFGEGHDSSCPYVGRDDIGQSYDYLVGEDKLEIAEVKKNGIPAFTLPLGLFTVWASDAIPYHNFQAQLFTHPSDPYAPGTYTGFFVKGLLGGIREKIWKVMLHEEPPRQYSAEPQGTLYFDQTYAWSFGGIGWAGIVPGVLSYPSPPVVTDSGSFRYDGLSTTAFGVNASMTSGAQTLVFTSSYGNAGTEPASIVGPAGMVFTQIDKRKMPFLGGNQNITLDIWAGQAVSTGTGRITVTMGGGGVRRGVIQTLKITNSQGPDAVVTSTTKIVNPSVAAPNVNIQKMDKSISFSKDVRSPAVGFTSVAAVAFVPFNGGASFPPPVCTSTGHHLVGGLTLAHGTSSFIGLAVAAKSTFGAARGVLTLREPFSQAEADSLPYEHPVIQVQEHTVLTDEPPYPNRTVLRFGRRQENLDGQLIQISASARRYKPQRVNLVSGSESLHNGLAWRWTQLVGSNTTRHVTLYLSGKPDTAPWTYTGPGGLTGVTTVYLDSTQTGFQWFIEQDGILPDDPMARQYILSFWYYARSGAGNFQAAIRVTAGGDPGYDFATGGFTHSAPFNTWQQGIVPLTITNPLDLPIEAFAINFTGNYGNPVQFGFVQLEKGTSFTHYERTGPGPRNAAARSIAWTSADVIKHIIQNPNWGIGEAVDEASFEQAARALQPVSGSTASLRVWPIEANGVLPGPFGVQPTVKDVLDELCRTRGMVLTRSLSAWHIETDAVAQPPGGTILGTEETPYDNVASLSLGQRPTILDSMSTLRLLHAPRLGRFSDSLEPFYAGGVDRTVGTIGTVKEATFTFIDTAETADRVSSYLAAYAPALDRPLQLAAGQEASTVQPGDVITLYAPRLQPQNLVLSSERENSPDGWFQYREGTGATPSILRNNALGPFGTTYSATRIQFGAAGTGRSVTASGKRGTIAGAPGPMLKACAAVWLKSVEAVTPTTCELLLRDAQSNGLTASYSTVVELGRTWKQYTVEQPIRAADAVVGMYFGIANPTGAAAKDVLMWGAQLSFDWPRGYVKTVGTAIDPTYVYKVTTVSHSREENTLTAIPYDANILFAPYSPGVIFMPRIPDDLTTSTHAMLPDPVTDLHLPPNTGIGPESNFASTPLTVGDHVWAEIAFTMPEKNVAGVVVQIQKAGALGWTDVAHIFNPLQPGQLPPAGVLVRLLGAPGSSVMVVAHNLIHESTYVVRCISYDARGRAAGFEQVSDQFIA